MSIVAPYYYEDELQTLLSFEGRELIGVAMVCHLQDGAAKDVVRIEFFLGEGPDGTPAKSIAIGNHRGSIIKLESPARLDPFDDLDEETRGWMANAAPAQRFDVSQCREFEWYLNKPIVSVRVLNRAWESPDLPGIHMQPDGVILNFGGPKLVVDITDDTICVNPTYLPPRKHQKNPPPPYFLPGPNAVGLHMLPRVNAAQPAMA